MLASWTALRAAFVPRLVTVTFAPATAAPEDP
jgi:hypothetical protein